MKLKFLQAFRGKAAVRNILISIIVILVLSGTAGLAYRVAENFFQEKGQAAKKLSDTGYEQFRKGNLKEAAAKLKEAVRENPKDAEAHYRLGLAYEGLGKLEPAIKAYEEAVKLDPDKASYHYNLAVLYRVKRETDQAISHLKKALELDPKLTGARLVLARTYSSNKQYDEAISHYQRVIKAKPYGVNLSQIHLELGMAYLSKGEKEKAKKELETALKINPKNSMAKELLEEL